MSIERPGIEFLSWKVFSEGFEKSVNNDPLHVLDNMRFNGFNPDFIVRQWAWKAAIWAI